MGSGREEGTRQVGGGGCGGGALAAMPQCTPLVLRSWTTHLDPCRLGRRPGGPSLRSSPQKPAAASLVGCPPPTGLPAARCCRPAASAAPNAASSEGLGGSPILWPSGGLECGLDAAWAMLGKPHRGRCRLQKMHNNCDGDTASAPPGQAGADAGAARNHMATRETDRAVRLGGVTSAMGSAGRQERRAMARCRPPAVCVSIGRSLKGACKGSKRTERSRRARGAVKGGGDQGTGGEEGGRVGLG